MITVGEARKTVGKGPTYFRRHINLDNTEELFMILTDPCDKMFAYRGAMQAEDAATELTRYPTSKEW